MSYFPSKVTKPFLKWVGGKSQLITQIESYYPFNDKRIKKYCEPFVGGGAILFNVLSHYKIEEAYISDINRELINTYICIRDNYIEMIDGLENLQQIYQQASQERRQEIYYQNRDRFNELKTQGTDGDGIEKAILMIFLNKTCFNGLYRVNKKGQFNVSMGSYVNPIIYDEENLKAVSFLLRNVNIICGDYHLSDQFIDDKTFVYFDPPYRPISNTSNFTAYTEENFSDEQQIELAQYVNTLNQRKAKILISNSDPGNTNPDDTFFLDLYREYHFYAVEATRMINSKGSGRGKIKELLISNF
ncbi:MAG: DNA adenine methylase [Lachnospiraceae bacterium]|nr:DNA adenine methylase [Lachnospiraceae bacterium]